MAHFHIFALHSKASAELPVAAFLVKYEGGMQPTTVLKTRIRISLVSHEQFYFWVDNRLICIVEKREIINLISVFIFSCN